MCLLDNEYECVVFYCMQDILERADMESFCLLMLRMWVINRHRMHYKTLIIEYLKQYSKSNRKEINKLLWDKLPDSLSDDQKKHKVHNLLTALKNKNIIEKDGENQRKANWILKD